MKCEEHCWRDDNLRPCPWCTIAKLEGDAERLRALVQVECRVADTARDAQLAAERDAHAIRAAIELVAETFKLRPGDDGYDELLHADAIDKLMTHVNAGGEP